VHILAGCARVLRDAGYTSPEASSDLYTLLCVVHKYCDDDFVMLFAASMAVAHREDVHGWIAGAGLNGLRDFLDEVCAIEGMI